MIDMTKRTLATIITKHHLWIGASADSLVKICSKQELQDYYDELYWEDRREKTMSEI